MSVKDDIKRIYAYNLLVALSKEEALQRNFIFEIDDVRKKAKFFWRPDIQHELVYTKADENDAKEIFVSVYDRDTLIGQLCDDKNHNKIVLPDLNASVKPYNSILGYKGEQILDAFCNIVMGNKKDLKDLDGARKIGLDTRCLAFILEMFDKTRIDGSIEVKILDEVKTLRYVFFGGHFIFENGMFINQDNAKLGSPLAQGKVRKRFIVFNTRIPICESNDYISITNDKDIFAKINRGQKGFKFQVPHAGLIHQLFAFNISSETLQDLYPIDAKQVVTDKGRKYFKGMRSACNMGEAKQNDYALRYGAIDLDKDLGVTAGIDVLQITDDINACPLEYSAEDSFNDRVGLMNKYLKERNLIDYSKDFTYARRLKKTKRGLFKKGV